MLVSPQAAFAPGVAVNPPPTTIRLCGIAIADTEPTLALVARKWPTMYVGRCNDDVCPIHDAGWPYPDLRPVGQCLVTYRLEAR